MAKKEKLQKLIFDKKIFKNKRMIRNWILKNNYIIDKRLKKPIIKLDKTFHVRQKNPVWFKKSTFKKRKIDKGIKGLYGYLK